MDGWRVWLRVVVVHIIIIKMSREASQGRMSWLLRALVLVAVWAGGECWCFDTTLAQLNAANEVDFSIDNMTLVAVDNNLGVISARVVNFWRLDTKEVVYVHNSSGGAAPVSAKFSKDGKLVGIGYNNGSVIILNVTGFTYTWHTTLSNPTGTGFISEIDFSWVNYNNLIVCGGSVIRYITVNGATVWPVTGINPSNGITSCKLSKLDDVGYSTSRTMTWATASGTTVQATTTVTGSGNTFTEVDFSLDGSISTTRLLSGNRDNRLYILPNGTSTFTNIGYGSRVPNTVCYGRDNLQMAVGDSGGNLFIYNTSSGTDINYQLFTGLSNITHCRFSYDMKYLITSTSTSNLYLYTTNCFVTQCQHGFYSSGGTCLSCSSIQGCLSCTSGPSCTACTQGYYLNGAVCASCNSIPNCRSCEPSNKCTECQQGFFLNYSSNACVGCQNSILGCYTCRRNSTNATVFCESCHSDYYLNSTDSLCYSCAGNIPNCMRCFTSTVCIECQMSHYLDASSACQPCLANCLACSASANCIACTKGFRSVSGVCTACGGGCLDCYNSGTCTSCGKGFSLSGGSCTACTLPCLTCGTSATNCLTCAVGFSSDGSGGCARCANNCVICSGSAVCSSCEVGYYLTGTFTCAACSGVTANCATCNSTQCFSCQNSFYLAANFTCQTCLSAKTGCLSCVSAATCEQCLVGYYLVTGSCTVCPSQCESCTSGSVCSACSVGYFLSGTTCSQCSNNCVTCTSGTNCLSCHGGYFLNTSATPNVCTRCLLSMAGCVSCSAATVCIECELGRYFSGGNCLFCPLACSTCNSTGVCLSCAVGYYLGGATCTKCNKNCSECSSGTVCSSCNTGYFLDTGLSSNNCVMCTAVGCQTCSSATACLTCEAGYYLSSTSCLPCNTTRPNCYSCSETLCIQCMYGYYNNAGTCTICSTLTGCAACTSNTVCNECTPGYYLLAGNTCGACPVQCKTCLNNVCKSCQAQYTMNAGATDCVLCEASLPACLTCSSTSVCSSCYEGYYLTSANVCASCRTNITGCLACSNASICLVCQGEYSLVGGVCTSCSSIQACTFCRNSTTCLSCLSGYYLNSAGTCSLCTVNLVGCLFCSSSSACLQCQTGYYLDTTTHACLLCLNSLAGCLSCASSAACTQCDGGYYLDSGTLTCKSCNVVGCQVCGDTSPGVCISCSMGYYLTGSTCNACSQTACLECSDSTTCMRCESGYHLFGSSCVSCKSSITACSKCVNSGVCSQCDSTYYLDSSNQCSQCSSTLSFCQICTSSSHCTACSSGYYSQSGICTSCASIAGCFMCTSATACQNCVNGYYLSGSTCATCSSALPNCYECASAAACLTCLSGYVLDTSGVCNQVTGGSAPAPLPIPMLGVKTYYVSSAQLKHVFSTKQSYSFTKQSMSWSTVTAISLYNSVSRSTTSLTISSVEWGPALMSIIFYTNNPLNLNAAALSMPLRLLLTQEDISFSYQTKFQMSQSALALLMPDQVIPNDFTQQNPLMEPSFYLSYLETTDEFYLSIIGFVIVATLFLNFIVRATCTASRSRNIGEIVPHILALKTCALMVFPIYPQISSFCYGLMGADLPWFGQYFSSLSISSDVQPAGFQLYYTNMNFAAVYLCSFLLCLLLLLLGYLTRSQPKKQDEVFTLEQEDEHNKGSHAYLRVVFMYFSFGLSLAGSASVQGALYNPVDYLSINGAFYMLGGVVLCSQLALSVYLTRKESRSCYIRSFLKALILSVAHISPVYICTGAVSLDLALVGIQYRKHKQSMKYPKVWVVKHVLANLSLLVLYYFNERKLALLGVVGVTFLSILIEIVEHANEGTAEEPSKRVKPAISDKDASEHDYRNETMHYFGDLKLQEGKEEQLIEPALGDTKTTFKDSKGFNSSSFVFDQDQGRHTAFPRADRTARSSSEKRSRPFRAAQRKKQVKIEPILEKVDSSRDQSPL